MDPNSIDYYIIDCAIPPIITIKNPYQIDFCNPGSRYFRIKKFICILIEITGGRQ